MPSRVVSRVVRTLSAAWTSARDVLALRLWFGRVGADVGGDGGLVAAGVLHDSLPGVDAAQPYVRLVLTEVAHRRRVPVGDLPFLVQRPAVPRLGVGLLSMFIGLPGLNVRIPETHHGHGSGDHDGEPLDPARPVQNPLTFRRSRRSLRRPGGTRSQADGGPGSETDGTA